MPDALPTKITSANAIQIGGLNCWDGGTKESIQTSGNTIARREIWCAWRDRLAIVQVLNPGIVTVGGVDINNVQPYPPIPYLYPLRFDIEGYGVQQAGNDGVVEYAYAKLTVEYQQFKGGDPQGYVEIEDGACVITLPRTGVMLQTVNAQGNDPLPIPALDQPGLPLAVTTIVRGRNNVNGLNLTLLQQINQAPVNSATFMGYDPGCVKYMGGRAIRQTYTNQGTGVDPGNGGSFNPSDPFGDLGGNGGTLPGIWQIEYRFSARPGLPWDFVPRMKNGKWDGFAKAQWVAPQSSAGTNGSTKYQGTADFIGRSDLTQLFS